MHLNSELVFNNLAKPFFSDNSKVLEIGADKLPTYYCESVNNESIEWFTLDIKKHWDTINIGENRFLTERQILSENEYNYPIEDNTFDIVFSAQVMEHVKDIWLWFDELKRITKKNGIIMVISPISWPYHVAPEVSDCWRIYPDGFKALAESKNLEIIENRFDSFEKELLPDFVPTIPGVGVDKKEDFSEVRMRRIIKMYKIMGRLPYFRNLKVPLQVSYDSFLVCKKID